MTDRRTDRQTDRQTASPMPTSRSGIAGTPSANTVARSDLVQRQRQNKCYYHLSWKSDYTPAKVTVSPSKLSSRSDERDAPDPDPDPDEYPVDLADPVQISIRPDPKSLDPVENDPFGFEVGSASGRSRVFCLNVSTIYHDIKHLVCQHLSDWVKCPKIMNLWKFFNV